MPQAFAFGKEIRLLKYSGGMVSSKGKSREFFPH
jgi:hypothetical protein